MATDSNKKKSRTFLDIMGMDKKEKLQKSNPFSVELVADKIINRKKKLKEMMDSMD